MVFAYSPSSPSTSYSTTSAMEIPTSSRSRSLSPSCAYPSWPQGPSLTAGVGRRASESTSFIISDEELFATMDFEDSSRDCSPSPTTPHTSRSPASPAGLYEQRVAVDNGSLMREIAAQEKAKREQQRRRKASAMKKSRSGSNKHMTPIVE